MKTVTVNYYTIDELQKVSPQGYKNAFNRYEKNQLENGYNWHHESIASVEKFLGLFDCQLIEFVMGSVYANDFKYTSIHLLDDELEIYGDELMQYLQSEHKEILEKWDECPLTGYCLDFTLLEPLHDFVTGEKYQDCSLKDLIDLSMSRAIEAVDADFEYQCGYEAFEEDSYMNDYHYDINGNLE